MPTKWDISANWSYNDWTTNYGALIGYLMGAAKGAADERVAFIERSHSSGFTEPNTFPDYDGKALLGKGSGATRNFQKIQNALYPGECIETDTIQGDGETWLGSNPVSLSLADLMDVLGYSPDNELLSTIATNTGRVNAAFIMKWFKQWFEVADYPEYYLRPLDTTGTTPFTELEVKYLKIFTEYDYEEDTSTFLSASCEKTTGKTPETTVDIYMANDLNESSPFSTPADVRTYTQNQFDTEWASATWQPVTDFVGEGSFETIGAKWREQIGRFASFPPIQVRFDYEIRNVVWRFKVDQEYRAASSQRYDVDIYDYHAITKITESGSGSPTFFDFGTGDIENEVVFVTLTPDVDGWHYLGINQALSYTGGPANLVVPTGVVNESVENYSLDTYFIPTPTTDKGVYFAPNKDGSWEYNNPNL